MDFSKLKNYLNSLVEIENTPGVDCIVYKEHEIIFRYFAGMSDIENNLKMNGKELYLIFSMTKMLTCVSALQLFEKGKYSMDDPLAKFMPEFKRMRLSVGEIDTEGSAKIISGAALGENVENVESTYASKPILIKDLFTMGAGLDYNLGSEGIKKAISQGRISTRDIAGALSETVLGFEPGTGFRYSLCHDVLGALVEIWSGKSLGEYMRENIFEPLGMNNTFFGVPKDLKKLSKMAALYIYDQDRKPQRLPLVCGFNITEKYESGGAGLTSCTEDYAVFLDALACSGIGKNGNRIISPETVELMKTNHLNSRQLEDFNLLRQGYGYGLGVRTHIDREKSGSLSPIGEFGWDGAAGAFSMVDTDNRISLTYFQHIHNWDLKIQNEMRNILYSCIE